MARWLLGATALCLAIPAGHASAQTVEVAPFGGYRFGGDLFERVTGQAVDLDGAPVVGGVVNVALHEGLWFEGLYSHQAARVTVGDAPGVPSRRWRVVVDHWLAGGLQEFGEGPARPFLTGMLGLTRYVAEDDNEIRFVVSAGGGVKLHPAQRFGIRLDGRVFTTFADIDGRAIACSPGVCFFSIHADVVWQAEFSAGLVVTLGPSPRRPGAAAGVRTPGRPDSPRRTRRMPG